MSWTTRVGVPTTSHEAEGWVWCDWDPQWVRSGIMNHSYTLDFLLCQGFRTLIISKYINWYLNSLKQMSKSELYFIWILTLSHVFFFKREYKMVKMAYQMVMWHGHVTIWYAYAYYITHTRCYSMWNATNHSKISIPK